MRSFELDRARSSAPRVDLCAIIPILACAYATIGSPLLALAYGASTPQNIVDSGLPNRIFWPAMTAISVILVLRNFSRIGRLTFPPHIICLFAYLALAGSSVLWAFNPELSFIRFLQQAMIIISIVLPALLAVRTADIMRGVFLCFLFASILNLFFIFNNSPSVVAIQSGYSGYFITKNQLGEFAAIACLLAFYEIHYRGLRRVLGIVAAIIAVSLILLSNSKTAFGLALLAPFLARLTLMARNKTGISPALLLLSIPLCYLVLSTVSSFDVYRLSYWLYGDSSFTGRTTIWAFASKQIELRPLFGWGYQSFWLVGPDGPSASAPGWVRNMPNSHNGYYDTMLETGYVGYTLLLIFIIATLHAVGRVADRDPARARLVLSLALFVILYNYLESFWVRGFEILWVVFVIVAAEIARYWQPLPVAKATQGSSPRKTAQSQFRTRRAGGAPAKTSGGADQPARSLHEKDLE
jgi:exopolysaccharide production protein ExoQ